MQNNTIELEIKAKIEEAQRQIKELNKEVLRLQEVTKKSNKDTKAQVETFKRVNESASKLKTTLIGLISAYAGIEGAKSFTEFSSKIEQGFIEIAKTTGLAGKELQALKDDLYNLTNTLSGIDFFALQDIVAGAGQLGIAKNDLIDFTEQIAKISVALDLEASRASEDMAVFTNVFKLPIKNVERLGSAINELSANTTANVDFILNTSKRMAGVGASFGLTADKVFALGATLKDLGVNAELGSTAVSEFMLKMQTDTTKYAKIAGLSLTEFTNTMKNEPIKAIQLFLDGLSKVDNQSATLKELGLNGSGLSQTMLGLANNTAILNKNLKISAEAYKQNTSIANEYKVASDSIKAKQADITNALVRLSKELVVELTPAIKSALESTKEFIDSIDPKAIADFAKGVLEAGGNLKDFISDNEALIKTVVELIVVFKALKVVLNSFSALAGFKSFEAMGKSLGLFSKDIKSIDRVSAKTIKSIGNLAKKFNALKVAGMAFVTSPIGGAIVALGVAIGIAVYKLNELNIELERQIKAQDNTNKFIKEAIDNYRDYNKLIGDNGKLNITSVEQQVALNKKLADSLKDIEAKRKELEANNNNGINDNSIALLINLEERYKKALKDVANVKKEDIELNKQALKAEEEYRNKAVALTLEHKKVIDSFIQSNGKRLDSNRYTLQQLELQELNYINTIKQLENELNTIRQKYSNQREELIFGNQQKVANLFNEDLNAYAQYEKQKTDIARLGELAREALNKGNDDLAKYYTNQQAQIIDQSIQLQKQKYQELGLTKTQIEQNYIDLLKSNENIQLQLINNQEQKELQAHLAKIEQTKIELEATKAQIEAQKELISLLADMQSKAKGVKFEADFSAIDESLQNLDSKIYELENKKRDIKIKLSLDKQELNSLDRNSKVNLKTKVDTSQAKRDIDNLAKSKPLNIKAKIDKGNYKEEILALTKTTYSKHIVKADVSEALRAINELKKPTSSVHTIYIKQVRAYNTGGYIDDEPKRFSTGGYTRKRGALAGFGGGDKIKALLEAGEFIQNKYAVRYYGKDIMEALNKRAIPKDLFSLIGSLTLPTNIFTKRDVYKFSEGGYTSSSVVSSGDDTLGLTPINLNIGNNSFSAFANREVAEALKEFLDNGAGL